MNCSQMKLIVFTLFMSHVSWFHGSSLFDSTPFLPEIEHIAFAIMAPTMKAMKTPSFTRHFERSDGANHVPLEQGSKSGEYHTIVDESTNMSCKPVWQNQHLQWISSLAFWALLATLPILAVIPRFLHALGVCLTAFCSMTAFVVCKHHLDSTTKFLSVALPIVDLLWAFPLQRLCAPRSGERIDVRFETRVQANGVRPMYMTPSICDLRGGSPSTADIGSKQWIDCIMSGLASRQLKPPVQQIRMLIQNEATVGRLQKAQSTKQQLDVICGAAFKAKLAWQKTSEPQPKDVTSDTETWRLRPRDWKICKPAVTEREDVVGDRVDAFRTSVDGDPLTQLWSRRSGAFFVSAVEAARVIRSVPIHKPPAGLYTLVTLEPTARSEATPVETVVLFQDDSPHMQKVFLTQLGTERLTHGTWKTVSLVAVETVEVLLEWWKDLCQGEDLDCFLRFEKLASAVASASGSKGKGKGHGKSKDTGKSKDASASVKIPDSLITDINAKLGAMLGDSPDTWKTFGHSIRDGIIRATVRLPKAVALRWLSQGTQHQAILARDISEFSDVADLRKVWVTAGCPVLDGTPVEIRQSLTLYLADVKASWAVIRTPYRWGVRVHKDHEREVKSILQPHAVYVPEGHVKFRIQNVPRSLDPEVLVATLTSQEFKPYLVAAHKTAVFIAAPLPPPDIVFVIQDLGVTLLLQPVSVPNGSAAPVPSRRHTEEKS